MSYLDTLRFHFSGNFFADPSTVNNHEAHYTISAFDRNKHWKRGSGGSPDHGWWNPEGANSFKFQNVKITGAMLAGGTAAAAGDAVLACEFASRGRPPGKIVDLDPDQQMVSMIFGLNLALVGPQGKSCSIPCSSLCRSPTSGTVTCGEAATKRPVPPINPSSRFALGEISQARPCCRRCGRQPATACSRSSSISTATR
jgi:hypothetical protein